jgi:hypothetical protein
MPFDSLVLKHFHRWSIGSVQKLTESCFRSEALLRPVTKSPHHRHASRWEVGIGAAFE